RPSARLPVRHILFPYTTLFRSETEVDSAGFDFGDLVGAQLCLASALDFGDDQFLYLIKCSECSGPIFVEANDVVTELGLHRVRRSEEHTSELQSRENIVCRLLL